MHPTKTPIIMGLYFQKLKLPKFIRYQILSTSKKRKRSKQQQNLWLFFKLRPHIHQEKPSSKPSPEWLRSSCTAPTPDMGKKRWVFVILIRKQTQNQISHARKDLLVKFLLCMLWFCVCFGGCLSNPRTNKRKTLVCALFVHFFVDFPICDYAIFVGLHMRLCVLFLVFVEISHCKFWLRIYTIFLLIHRVSAFGNYNWVQKEVHTNFIREHEISHENFAPCMCSVWQTEFMSNCHWHTEIHMWKLQMKYMICKTFAKCHKLWVYKTQFFTWICCNLWHFIWKYMKIHLYHMKKHQISYEILKLRY